MNFIYLGDVIVNPDAIAYLEVNPDEPDTLFVYLTAGDCILLEQPEAKRFLLNYCDVSALSPNFLNIINRLPDMDHIDQTRKRLNKLLGGK